MLDVRWGFLKVAVIPEVGLVSYWTIWCDASGKKRGTIGFGGITRMPFF